MKPARALETVEAPDERHLRAVDTERRGARFAALDHDVARVLGPYRGAAILYGFLASSWFEYADPAKIAEYKRKTGKKVTIGGWVEVSYKQFMAIAGTNARASIIAWLDVLAEDQHACPWGRCEDEHPLVVRERLGQNRPNRYRKWRCGEDVRVLRRRVNSENLRAAAHARASAFGRPNPAVAPAKTTPDQLPLLGTAPEVQPVNTHDPGPEVQPVNTRKFTRQTAGRPAAELPEVHAAAHPKTSERTSQRGNTRNTDSVGEDSSQISANAAGATAAAAVEDDQVDEVDAVGFEIIDGLLALARRNEPDTTIDHVWSVARRLARAALAHTANDSGAARRALARAIADPRLPLAKNPVGFLVRGVLGTPSGEDRYLLAPPANHAPPAAPTRPNHQPAFSTPTGLAPGMHEALVERLRRGDPTTADWLREREIPPAAVAIARALIADEPARPSATPRCDALAAADPATFAARLENVRTRLAIPGAHALDPNAKIIVVFCRAKLEAELEREAIAADQRVAR